MPNPFANSKESCMVKSKQAVDDVQLWTVNKRWWDYWDPETLGYLRGEPSPLEPLCVVWNTFPLISTYSLTFHVGNIPLHMSDLLVSISSLRGHHLACPTPCLAPLPGGTKTQKVVPLPATYLHSVLQLEIHVLFKSVSLPNLNLL